MRERAFSPLVEKAIELASQWHDRTYRKGSWRKQPFPTPEGEPVRIPVMAHLTAVAMAVQRAGWDDVTVAAAFLHDVIEDGNQYGSELRYFELCNLIGDEVANLVRDVTEMKYDDEGGWRGWHARKRDYVDHLREAPVRAAAISLADKLHNLWSINQSLERHINVFESSPTRRKLSAGPTDQRWFYQAVLDATAHHTDPRLEALREHLTEEMDRFGILTDEMPD